MSRILLVTDQIYSPRSIHPLPHTNPPKYDVIKRKSKGPSQQPQIKGNVLNH